MIIGAIHTLVIVDKLRRLAGHFEVATAEMAGWATQALVFLNVSCGLTGSFRVTIASVPL